MIIESGIIIFVGFILLMIKLPNWQIAILLGKPLQVDFAATVLAYVLHFGTFTGVMAAAVAGLLMSAMTTISRELVGYTVKEKGEWVYTPGAFDILSPKLNTKK
jgi:hypothetical protein